MSIIDVQMGSSSMIHTASFVAITIRELGRRLLSTREDGSLIGSRFSDQRNEIGETNEWGIGWARDLQAEERKGQETVISKKQVNVMFYAITHRPPIRQRLNLNNLINDLRFRGRSVLETLLTHSVDAVRATDPNS